VQECKASLGRQWNPHLRKYSLGTCSLLPLMEAKSWDYNCMLLGPVPYSL
jgi:hypothetical protein